MDAHGRQKPRAVDVWAAHTVYWELLPPLLRHSPKFQKRLRSLADLLKRLRLVPAMPGNLHGIEFWLESRERRRGRSPEAIEPNREAADTARAYAEAITALAEELNLAGPWVGELLHRLVQSEVRYGDGRFERPWTISSPVRLSIDLTIEPMTRYYPDDILRDSSIGLAGDRVPPTSWSESDGEFVATATVRDLIDARTVLDEALKRLAAETGLLLRKHHRTKYSHLHRNVRWFYMQAV